jgi:hypothetical protein
MISFFSSLNTDPARFCSTRGRGRTLKSSQKQMGLDRPVIVQYGIFWER